MKFAVTAVCALTLLAGCSSLGQAYPFPTREDAFASLQAQGRSLYLLTFDENGCYAGKTRLQPDAAFTPVRVVPNQRLVIESDNVIVMTVAFTPREKGRYWLTSVEGPVQRDPDETFFQAITRGEKRQVIIGVTEMDDATQQLKPVKLVKLYPRHKSALCIKLD
ncbi:hypothetical protein AWB70_00169 [Caballeronia cordobensis]|uniref:Lipoprotein n=1 Tax=Caballeronia cordobensis TaxID=1353886 RepID=A0A158ERW8_CABCO|nr:hypothetical protein [Caballeronia cordobensis]SAL10297.1 hypothetical protein AWB70_00169 [Caballeronia cordobensis]